MKIYGGIFDKETLLTLYTLIRKKFITEVGGIINSGKEAVLLHGRKSAKEVAIKVYKTLTSNFKERRVYIEGDLRFKRMKKDMKHLVYLWALKEYKNLKRMYDAGVNVPKPITCKKNILVMKFIGEKGTPAPLLKDIEINDANKIFTLIKKDIEKMYKNANLVHGDLSEYNILIWDTPFIIDVSQAVLSSHPYALDFLRRDIERIFFFFKKNGVTTGDPLSFLKQLLKEGKGNEPR